MRVPEEQITAYHEAGHALADVLLDLPFERVSIVPMVGRQGGVTFGSAPHSGPALELRLAVAALAGPAAPELIFEGSDEGGIETDVATARHYLRALVGTAELPIALREADRMARTVLRSHFPALCHIAGALLAQQMLAYRDVRELVPGVETLRHCPHYSGGRDPFRLKLSGPL